MFGKTLRLFILLLPAFSFSSLADPPPDAKLFALPAPSLRVIPAPQPVQAQAEPPAEMNLTSESLSTADLAIQRTEALTGRPILTAPLPRDDSGGAYGFLKPIVLDPITNPEAVKFGKVQMAGGLVGAFKHKNPFYLLNPLVFSVDW